MNLLYEVIDSYENVEIERGPIQGGFARKRGIPIGNLTSQIFANIYMNEFDRYVKHMLKPRAYLRYGDDFFIITDTFEETRVIRERCAKFLKERICLEMHPKNDIIVPVKRGLKFLGVEIFPKGRRLKKRNRKRVLHRADIGSISSYSGLIKQNSKVKRLQ